jgi:hypothetical protein
VIQKTYAMNTNSDKKHTQKSVTDIAIKNYLTLNNEKLIDVQDIKIYEQTGSIQTATSTLQSLSLI